MADHFNIAVIGGGPGGYVAALKAAQMGASVAIIEKHHLGGTCLNYGCIPSKALLASAELLHSIRRAESLGVLTGSDISFSWKKIQQRKDKVVAGLRGGIKGLLTARKAKIYAGSAKLDGSGRIAVDGKSPERLTADRIIIATGSTPSRVPGWPTDPAFVCTSDEALHWEELPASLLIVGGGVIGCEFACMMQAFGVEVTVVEMLPGLLPNMEGMLGETLKKTFEKRGVKVYCGVKINDLQVLQDRVVAQLSNGETVRTAKALVATGRRPATADLGLESVGLSVDRGFIRVDDTMATPVKGYYCIGDANGRCLLAHAASAQGVAAVENALGHGRPFVAPIPSAVYTFPEIAGVGMTSEEAAKRNLPVTAGHFPLSFLGKALAVGDSDGFVRVVRNRESDELLGVHMLGHNATECIAAAGVALHQKMSVRELAEVVFAHPTISESIKESAEDALFEGLHMPPKKVVRVAV